MGACGAGSIAESSFRADGSSASRNPQAPRAVRRAGGGSISPSSESVDETAIVGGGARRAPVRIPATGVGWDSAASPARNLAPVAVAPRPGIEAGWKANPNSAGAGARTPVSVRGGGAAA